MPTPYQLDMSWDDGYAEGYGAKLVDVGAPWTPTGSAAEVEAIADFLTQRYASMVTTRADAIGMARGIIKVARSVI